MINGNTIHYIGSGMSHTRVESMKDSTTIEWARQIIKKMNTKDYQFGFLYNAFTEKNLGMLFNQHYRDVLCDIHADSGGLQMVTVGAKATHEMKQKIYEHQAKHSTIAMSFDEIPVITLGANDTRSFNSRKFDYNLVQENARLSGLNLVDQLKLFADRKTKAKPLLIAQGNCIDTYRKWVDVVQKQIPKELLQLLGGVAMAGTSMGDGDLENVRTAFIFSQLDLDFDCKQVHLLGVGSMGRFIPTMVFMKSGLYKNLVVSFDSTTHTRCVTYCRYYNKDNNCIILGKYFDKLKYEELLKYLQFFETDIETAEELYYYLAEDITISKLKEAKDSETAMRKFLQAKFSFFLLSVKNTLDCFTDYLHDRNVSFHTKPLLVTPMRMLQQVKTLEDYNSWERNFSKYLKTNPVPATLSNTLEEFFV